MEIKQVGNHLESACVGCGEVLLIADGDMINFRIGETSIDGEILPVPQGLLCFVCNKKENGSNYNGIRFGKLCCSKCGREADEDHGPENFRPVDEQTFLCDYCDADQWD
jgi:hypothetical protein